MAERYSLFDKNWLEIFTETGGKCSKRGYQKSHRNSSLKKGVIFKTKAKLLADYLSSERERLIQEAKNDFVKNGYIFLAEPCDCGSQIRHNNSGNYHDNIELQKDSGEVFVKFRNGSTYEYDDVEWEECDNWEKVIEECGDWF